MQAFEINISPYCPKETYHKLLKTFVTEFSEGIGEETCEEIATYLLKEHLKWYYALAHQFQYFSKYQTLDAEDVNYIMLTNEIDTLQKTLNTHSKTNAISI